MPLPRIGSVSIAEKLISPVAHHERKVIVLSSTHQGRSHAQSSDTKKKVTRSTAGLLVASTQVTLVAAGIVCIVLAGLLGWHYQHVKANVAWLDRHDATYQWHYQVPHLERLTWQKIQSKLAPILGQATVSDIHSVVIDHPSLTDEDLTVLSGMSHLNNLALTSDQATNETLARIAALEQLRSVTLNGGQFTFEGLLELRKLPRLRYLNLRDMHISMAELAVLESAVPLANLKYNKASMPQYERRVVGRYPKSQPAEVVAEAGFQPLIETKKTM